MSMEISGNYKDYRNDYLERMQEGQGKAKEIEKEQSAENNNILIPKDEYINSEKTGKKPSGLYRMGQDENGNPKVLFDDPKKSGGEDGTKVKSDSTEKGTEKCTGNTDKVDREIKKLKEQKQQLEQQIRAAFEDEEKVRKLEKKLAQIEKELNRKDNDAYRRQHSTFSESNS